MKRVRNRNCQLVYSSASLQSICKIQLLVFVFSVALLFTSCKKDHPKDIPEWLENRIKEEKKDCRDGCDCDHGNCWGILEYVTNQNSRIYLFQRAGGGGDTYYDSAGNILCFLEEGLYKTCSNTCSHFTYCDIEFSRIIWIQKSKIG